MDAEVEHRQQGNPLAGHECLQEEAAAGDGGYKGLPNRAPIHYIVSAQGTAN
jgi:hypothetical protein